MKRTRQLSLLKDPRRNTKLWWIQKQHTYGGALNYRKVARPFDSKKLIHVVFKAKVGKAVWFTRSQRSIEKVLVDAAQRYGVRLKDFAIQTDHIHVLAYGRRKEEFSKFLRFFAAEMGRKYKGVFARLGFKKPQDFWVHRPFTRLVSWSRRSLSHVLAYFKKNRDEALGFIKYQPRRHRLSSFLARWETQLAFVESG